MLPAPETGTSEHLLDARARIGCVRVSRLAEDPVGEVEPALEDLERRGLRGRFLDLRGSEGGLMAEAAGVADLFLHDGRVLSTVTRGATRHHDAIPVACTEGPLVVRIDSGTATSSEFLAAGAAGDGRAVFAGRRTFGKGRIQEPVPLGEGGLEVLPEIMRGSPWIQAVPRGRSPRRGASFRRGPRAQVRRLHEEARSGRVVVEGGAVTCAALAASWASGTGETGRSFSSL